MLRTHSAAEETACTAPSVIEVHSGRHNAQLVERFGRLADGEYVRADIVAGLLTVSAATLWSWVRSGRVVAPERLSPKITAWRVGELRRFLQPEGEA